MDYRWLVKSTFRSVKSENFRRFLLSFYRKNSKETVKGEYMRKWEEMLRNISAQQKDKVWKGTGQQNFRFENCLINIRGFRLDYKNEDDQMRQIMHLFMRLQINYIHAVDFHKDRKFFRLLNILTPNRSPKHLANYFLSLPPVKIGQNQLQIPLPGDWQPL